MFTEKKWNIINISKIQIPPNQPIFLNLSLSVYTHTPTHMYMLAHSLPTHAQSTSQEGSTWLIPCSHSFPLWITKNPQNKS